MDAGTGRRGPIVPGTSVPSGAVPTRLAPVVVEVAMTSILSGHPAPSPVGDGEPLTVGEPWRRSCRDPAADHCRDRAAA
jgi:hypothetical protein